MAQKVLSISKPFLNGQWSDGFIDHLVNVRDKDDGHGAADYIHDVGRAEYPIDSCYEYTNPGDVLQNSTKNEDDDPCCNIVREHMVVPVVFVHVCKKSNQETPHHLRNISRHAQQKYAEG
eukprot:CAMPEP_0179482510 /NCGR_PEP_ID=MMETSP0799-20121207/60018_1 /TAXON_ID=46947 /ORGANISM="Geminigera cryophila, Strain CCMP2564" /LENGTH=119 /DNA_ID=CAMNT_0021295749 /DNA_START=112 /DNA_END=471 /DNA_ORIENTATION=-